MPEKSSKNRRRNAAAGKRDMSLPDIPVMILCGGMGTRLRDVTEVLPKPMVPIGAQPILWHIMKSYAAFGFKRFILCLGYKQEAFIDFFMNFHLRTADTTITLGHDPKIQFHGEVEEADWQVTLAQTGLGSATGKRVAIASKYLKKTDRNFFLTYGDGVSDVDIAALYKHHLASKKMLTVTAVHAPARFGELQIKDDELCEFNEKIAASAGYINGGFMVVDRKYLSVYLNTPAAENDYFEATSMHRAIQDRQIGLFRHEGFWQCMDTPREFSRLNDLWARRKAPWTRYWGK